MKKIVATMLVVFMGMLALKGYGEDAFSVMKKVEGVYTERVKQMGPEIKEPQSYRVTLTSSMIEEMLKEMPGDYLVKKYYRADKGTKLRLEDKKGKAADLPMISMMLKGVESMEQLITFISPQAYISQMRQIGAKDYLAQLKENAKGELSKEELSIGKNIYRTWKIKFLPKKGEDIFLTKKDFGAMEITTKIKEQCYWIDRENYLIYCMDGVSEVLTNLATATKKDTQGEVVRSSTKIEYKKYGDTLYLPLRAIAGSEKEASEVQFAYKKYDGLWLIDKLTILPGTKEEMVYSFLYKKYAEGLWLKKEISSPQGKAKIEYDKYNTYYLPAKMGLIPFEEEAEEITFAYQDYEVDIPLSDEVFKEEEGPAFPAFPFP